MKVSAPRQTARLQPRRDEGLDPVEVALEGEEDEKHLENRVSRAQE